MSIYAVRSGTVRAQGEGALFVTPRAVSCGDIHLAQLQAGARPPRSAEAQLIPGDVLVVARGPVNAAAVVDTQAEEPMFATLDLAVLRPGDGVDGGYLAWYINLPSTQQRLAEARTGGAVARLPLPALEALSVRVPPLDIQRGIATLAALGRRENKLAGEIADLRRRCLEAALEIAVETHTREEPRPCMA